MHTIVSHTVVRVAATAAVAATLCIAGSCAQVPVGQPTGQAGSPPSASIAAIEQSIHEGINRHRASIGRRALVQDPLLTALARRHSENMASGAVPFGHDGFEERFEAARQTGAISRFSENVATNYNFPAPAVSAKVVSGWIESPGHRQNLEGDFHMTGVGVARSSRGDYYATQIYAR